MRPPRRRRERALAPRSDDSTSPMFIATSPLGLEGVTMRRRTLLSLCGFAAAAPLVPPAPARAQQAWPSRPVTILVPFVAGGASDITARAIATRMQQSLGKPVVVENRPGAGGEVAGRAFASSAPDGHTLMVGSIGVFAINPALRPNL